MATRFRLKSQVIHTRMDPQDIGFVQYPEFFWQTGRRRKNTHLVAGNWDQEIDARLYWSGKYEVLDGVEDGMLPLDKFVFFSSAKDHFLNAVPWNDTPWLQWVRENSIRRYETESQICERLQLLDDLYDACLSDSFEVSKDQLPLINIGRDNRISIDDGRHRLCVAIIAGLRDIPVQVSTLHPDAKRSKYVKVTTSTIGAGWTQRLKSALSGVRN